MRRVCDVVLATGEGFDRRPAEPMPREVQRAHRDALIDHAHVREIGCEVGRQAIVPGAREQGDLDRRACCASARAT